MRHGYVDLSSPIPQRVITLPRIWGRETQRADAERSANPPSGMTDEEALTRLKAKDKDALEVLFERYSKMVLTIGFRILRDYGEAEEVAQNVFLYLYQKAELFHSEKGTARAWIAQVAYHRALDRREYLAHRQFYLGTDLTVPPDTLSGGNDVELEVGAKLKREQLLKAVEDLPEKQRKTLQLFFFEGLELSEISERLGEAVANVRHYYYRG